MELYPLDYQLTLGRILRERLAVLHYKGAHEESARMQQALSRLYGNDFGACRCCGAVIPYLDMLSDPTTEHCGSCKARNARSASSAVKLAHDADPRERGHLGEA